MAQAARHVPARERVILGAAYWRVWWANTVSSVGDGAVTVALPLLAVTITRDPRLIALVSAAFYLPWLLLSLPVGALADRHDRVALMWRAQAVQCIVVALLAVLAVIGAAGIAVLIAAGFFLGAAEVVFSNAAQAELPRLVPAQALPKANGNLQVSLTLGETFLGPPLGSVLFAAARALPFGLDAGSFAVSAALLSGLPRRDSAIGERAPAAGLRGSVMEGLRWLLRHRLLRIVAVLLGAANFGSQMGQATLVLLATQTLHVGAKGYGLLWTAAAVGSILGGLANPAITRRAGDLPSLIIAMAAFAAVYVAIGLAPGAIVLGLLMACNGFFATMWNVVTVSLRQRIVPDELLGRVNSVYRMIGWGLIPLGALAGGFAARLGGLRAPYLAGGAVCGLALLLALPALLSARRSPQMV
ncbi:MAG TPA: MFS transporter [Streptosporangiaceae bacterium]|nr:MFS transporter [Streptosporangiaceae bacterium]